jgi:hypothetical protein
MSQMKEFRHQIIEAFKEIDQYKYATWKPEKYDRTEILKEVKEALDYHCPNQSFSDLLVNQLIELQGSGMVKICGYSHPYIPKEIYWTMEQIIRGEHKHKPFKKKGSKLFGKNILHVHHSKTHYIMMNCIRYFERCYTNDSEILNRLKELQLEHPDRTDHMVLFANEVLLKSINWMHKTGEWLVYQKKDNVFQFLCLYIHDYEDTDDSKLYEIIKNDIIT